MLTPEQTDKYRADATKPATPALHALCVVAATCGLREGELLGPREGDIDLGAGVLAVRQQLVRGGRTPVFGPRGR